SSEVIQRQMAEGGMVASPASGYIQEITHPALVASAAQADAVIYLFFRPGQFVLQGEPLASIWPASKRDLFSEPIRRNVAIGRHRVLSQAVESGVQQIGEIPLRALTPAINDTFTGIACVDCLGEAIVVLAEQPTLDGCWYDAERRLRLRERPVLIERLI